MGQAGFTYSRFSNGDDDGEKHLRLNYFVFTTATFECFGIQRLYFDIRCRFRGACYSSILPMVVKYYISMPRLSPCAHDFASALRILMMPHAIFTKMKRASAACKEHSGITGAARSQMQMQRQRLSRKMKFYGLIISNQFQPYYFHGSLAKCL